MDFRTWIAETVTKKVCMRFSYTIVFHPVNVEPVITETPDLDSDSKKREPENNLNRFYCGLNAGTARCKRDHSNMDQVPELVLGFRLDS